MTIRPDSDAAFDAAGRLMSFSGEVIRDLPQDDEGRTMSLAMAMFVGAFMASLKNIEDRQEFCKAALGFSFRTDMAIDELGIRNKPGDKS